MSASSSLMPILVRLLTVGARLNHNRMRSTLYFDAARMVTPLSRFFTEELKPIMQRPSFCSTEPAASLPLTAPAEGAPAARDQRTQRRAENLGRFAVRWTARALKTAKALAMAAPARYEVGHT